METLFTSLPNTFLGWMAVITLFVVGSVAVYGLFDKQIRERRKDGNASEDRLIDILKKTVDELETKVNKQTKDIDELTTEVNKLRIDNEKYLSILQGRDAETKEFYKQAFESMKLAHDTHDVVTTLAKNMEVANNNTTRLIDLLGRHIEAIDHAASAAVGGKK